MKPETITIPRRGKPPPHEYAVLVDTLEHYTRYTIKLGNSVLRRQISMPSQGECEQAEFDYVCRGGTVEMPS